RCACDPWAVVHRPGSARRRALHARHHVERVPRPGVDRVRGELLRVISSETKFRPLPTSPQSGEEKPSLHPQPGRTGLVSRHSTTRLAVVPAAALAPGHLAADVCHDAPDALQRRVIARAEVSKQAHVVAFLVITVAVACATGLTTISSMSTCGGRVTANRTQSAMSAALSGFNPA